MKDLVSLAALPFLPFLFQDTDRTGPLRRDGWGDSAISGGEFVRWLGWAGTGKQNWRRGSGGTWA